MAHQSLAGWAASGFSSLPSMALSLGLSAVSALSSAVAYAAAGDDDGDLANHALRLSAGSIALAAITLAGAIVKGFWGGFWDDRKDARANELAKFKAELEAKDAADAERRENQRQLDATTAANMRNKLDAAYAKIKALQEGQRTNGRAIEQIGSATDIPVVVAMPPEGSGDHPVIP